MTTPRDTAPFVRGLVLAGVLYAIAFLGLSVGGHVRSLATVIGAVVLLVAAAAVLQLTLDRGRDVLTRPQRLAVPLAIIGVGVLLLAAWGLLTWRGHTTGGWGLAGLCAFYLGIGHLLGELRKRTGGAPARGLKVGAACAAVFVLGLVLCFTVSGWWLALCVVAVLAAPVGLSLLSEDVLREPLPWPRAGIALAALALVISALWLAATGAPVLLIALALAALVPAIASSTQADVLLVVTVLALVWTTIPRGVDPDASLTPVKGKPTLVALGDSYMSGEGAQTFYEGTNVAKRNECRRSPDAYAPSVAREQGLKLAFFACSGAVAVDLHQHAHWPDEPVGGPGMTQLAQVKRLDAKDIRLVIVSIGGNDAGFADLGVACVAPGSCVERGQLWLDRLDDRVAGEVNAAYDQLEDQLPGVPVLVVPYPQPVAAKSCPASLLEDDEHQFVNAFVSQLNGVIADAARSHGFFYLRDMETVLTDSGRRICDPNQAGVNFIALKSINGFVDQAVMPTNWIHNSFHPNELGHEEMKRVLDRWLNTHPGRDTAPPGGRRTLTELMEPDPEKYCRSQNQPRYCSRGDNEWAVTQVGFALRDLAIPALLMTLGFWLVWLPVIAWARPHVNRFGDGLARRLWRTLSR